MQYVVNLVAQPAVVWGLMAGVPAISNEYLYRVLAARGGSFFDLWWVFLPSQLLIGYSVWRLVTVPTLTLLDAFVVWALCTTVLRVLVSVLLLHDMVKPGTWFALGLLVMARIAQAYWGR